MAYWLIIILVSYAPPTSNAAVSHSIPPATYVPMSSADTCAAAKAKEEAHSIGNFHVLAECVAQ